jgi:bifunctional non-homologous end joining protein LigD
VAAASSSTSVEIDGRQLKLSNLDKVLYPATGFTKGEVIDYYARVASVMVEHVGDRGVTLRRFPNGVDAGSFFEKRCAGHRPDWVPVCLGPGDSGGAINYCRLDSRAALVWSANMAALEVHAPMARCDDIETPTMVVFDLDPGAPAAIRECCEVALSIRDVVGGLGLAVWPKTSGSKGLQLYLPVNRPGVTHEHASGFALAVAQVLERHDPEHVTSVMAKAMRPGKVFVDWSQNSRHKTTVAPYSLRARPDPTVSTTVTWEEVEAGAAGDDDLVFEAADVLARVDEQGDLFGPTLSVEQDLPQPS